MEELFAKATLRQQSNRIFKRCRYNYDSDNTALVGNKRLKTDHHHDEENGREITTENDEHETTTTNISPSGGGWETREGRR